MTDLFSTLSLKRSVALTELFDFYCGTDGGIDPTLPPEVYLRWLKQQRVRMMWEDQRERRDVEDFITVTSSAVPALSWYCVRCGAANTGRRPENGRCEQCSIIRGRRR